MLMFPHAATAVPFQQTLQPTTDLRPAERPSLDKLGREAQTDKATHHSYTMLYENHIREWRDEPINLMEIGVLGEASLQMWDNYFSRASVFGVDITPHNDSSRILQADQSKLDDLRRLRDYRPWTIINDDGSHVPSHQLLTFTTLFPSLAPGGVYILEDLETNYWKPGSTIYGYTLESEPNMHALFKKSLFASIDFEFASACGVPSGEELGQVFGHGVDEQIAEISFIRNAIIVRKKPSGYIEHPSYRFARGTGQDACLVDPA